MSTPTPSRQRAFAGAPLLGALLIAACEIMVPAAAAGAQVPSNARASAFGAGWNCIWGYRRVEEHCDAVKAPANGYVEPSGRDWECNRGFLKDEQQCVKVNVPANAHLEETWLNHGWRCNRGFRKVGDACARMRVAELDGMTARARARMSAIFFATEKRRERIWTSNSPR